MAWGFVNIGGGSSGSLSDVFSENSWDDIARACQSGSVPDSWKVGDVKYLDYLGIGYPVTIIGKNHDDYADGSGKAPLTLMFIGTEPITRTTKAMNSSGTNTSGWGSCPFRSELQALYCIQLPAAIKPYIREVNKLTSSGNQSSTIVTTADKLFLLSEVEIAGTTSKSFAGEGTVYKYFADDPSRKYDLYGTSGQYWLRSPYKGNTNSYVAIYKNTKEITYLNSNQAGGFFPAFCL